MASLFTMTCESIETETVFHYAPGEAILSLGNRVLFWLSLMNMQKRFMLSYAGVYQHCHNYLMRYAWLRQQSLQNCS